MNAIERDFYEERRRKWRRSAFWRGFFFAFLVLILLGVGLAFLGGDTVSSHRDHIARVDVTGFIGDDRERDEMLREIAESDAAQALIVRIDSPGGTTAGAESLYGALRAVAAEKPVVSVLGEIAASGGYVTAIATDHIIARGNTLTGSIGVIMEYPDVTSLMDRLGIEVDTIRSSPLKAEPSPFRETSPAARRVSEAMVADAYGWFRDLVADRRGLSGEALEAATNGAVLTGRMARTAGLVDEIGGEAEAVDWLESRQAGLRDLPVVQWEREEEETGLGWILGGFAPTGRILGEISGSRGPKLYSIAR
jgi:protease IV